MSLNGRLPDSALAPIPGGRLRKDAAVSWNVMHRYIGVKTGVWIRPLGGMSSYRTYPQQVYLWHNVPHAHDTNWVAYPGTSNHGWGLAVDVATQAMAREINRYGAPFGWQKRWSDAQLEWWHFKWRSGIYKPPANKYPTIRKGSKGRSVRRAQVLLRQAGYLPARWHAHNSYTLYVRRRVRKFQKMHGLKVDGIIGSATWGALRKAANR